MDVRVLGRIEIIDPADAGGRRLTGDDLPRRARQVLGVLAARHDRVQSKDALADAVWGEDLPGNHAAALEHYVSVLRRALQPGVSTGQSFIVTRAGGYVFATDRARLDLAELRAAARVADAEPDRADVREQIVRLARDLPFAEDEYAEWAAPVRAEVKAALVGALLDLADRAAATSGPYEAGRGEPALQNHPDRITAASRPHEAGREEPAPQNHPDRITAANSSARTTADTAQADTDTAKTDPHAAETDPDAAETDADMAGTDASVAGGSRDRAQRIRSAGGPAQANAANAAGRGPDRAQRIRSAGGPVRAERDVGGDPGRALRLAREAIDLEPYAERGYRIAMRAGAAQGRADEVVRWFEQCRRALVDDLGVEPAADTAALRDSLLAGLRGGPPDFERRRGDRRTAAAPVRLAVVKDFPVVPLDNAAFAGRSAELDALAGGVGVVHVVGPAGAGKSALLGRLRELHPGRVGLGRGPGPGGALRLGWLRTVLHQLGAPADGALDAAMAERRALRPAELDGIVEGLRYHGEERPIVAIDDAEHLDADSVAELRWLQERGVRIVVSYRYPSAIAERPLGALDAGLVLRLAPLNGADLDAGVLEASGGIPALVAAGRELGGDLAAEVAMHLARQRTRWMPPAAWEILRLTAALGSLRVEQLAAAGGLELDEVLGAVDQLVHAHLLVEGPGGHVRHRSELVRAAVATQVSAARGHHLRTRLA